MVIAALVKLNAIPIDGTWEFYNNIEEVATGLQVCTVISLVLLTNMVKQMQIKNR